VFGGSAGCGRDVFDTIVCFVQGVSQDLGVRSRVIAEVLRRQMWLATFSDRQKTHVYLSST
jgi:hypothetical protein